MGIFTRGNVNLLTTRSSLYITNFEMHSAGRAATRSSDEVAVLRGQVGEHLASRFCNGIFI